MPCRRHHPVPPTPAVCAGPRCSASE
jgi:hypothetical protein